MSKKNSKKHLFISLFIAAFFIIFLFCFESGIQIRKIWFGSPIKILVLVYGNDKVSSGRLDAFAVYMDRKQNLIKVLSIDTDIIEPNGKGALRKSFNKTAETDIELAKKNFYASLNKVLDDKFKPDYYISASFEDLSSLLITYGKLSKLILKDDFNNSDDREINSLQIFDTLLSRFETMSVISGLGIPLNLDKFNTKLSRAFFYNLALYFALYKNDLLFCILPARKTSLGVEPIKNDISDFFENIFFADIDNDNGRLDGFIDIKNASKKQGAAQSAAWLLRKENLDVLDYSNSGISSDKTIIKDYKGNLLQANKIAQVLECGKIIISYDSNNNYDTTVFIGKDYKNRGIKKNGKL
ncbi:MAG: LytR C-terminal domain-containing protein [Elusimicrobiota bacterium]|jgi:hypothetical protein|nr:LytR C-terminal domain-containing protein [Elusimicrobiota bacterium]